MITVTFNGVELTRQIIVTKGFTSLSGAEFDPISNDNEMENGSQFLKMRRKSKPIKVPFFVRYDTISEYDNLERSLSVTEPKKLTFSHMPDRYFIATPIGDLDFKEVKLSGQGTITFKIYGGAALAVNPKKVNGSQIGTALNQFKLPIANDGSDEGWPIIKITHKSDNGSIGIAGPNGVIAIGDLGEVDMDDKPSKVGLLSKLTINNSTRNTSNQMGLLTQGVLTQNAQGHTVIQQKGQWGDGKKWCGGYHINSFTPAGVGDEVFYSHFQLSVETGLASQTGHMRIVYLDSSNRIVAMYEIHKPSPVNNEAHLTMWYGGNSLRRHLSFKFEPNYKVGNPFRAATHGSMDFEKRGGRLRFFWYGKTYSVLVPELAEIPISRVGVFIGQYGTRDIITAHFPTHFAIKSLRCEKTNQDVLNGFKNEFQTGDVVEIDMGSAEISVNGKPRNDLFVDGGGFFSVPTGSSHLEIILSDWIEKAPDVTGEIRERFIC